MRWSDPTDAFFARPPKKPKTDVFIANIARDYVLLEAALAGVQDKVQADKLYLKGSGNFIMHKLKLSKITYGFRINGFLP